MKTATTVRLCKLLVAGAALVMAGAVWAESETPTSLSGGKIVSVEDARKLADGKSAFFVDARSVLNFGKGHVPGAQASPYKGNSEDAVGFDAAKDQFEVGKLPPGKDQLVVFYSDGPTGWKSYKAAVWAVKAGYKNVGYMRSGWMAWQAKGFPVEN